jgi:hypothetical protein
VERIEKQSRVRILDAVRKKLRDVLSRPDLEMVALDYFRRLGHDNHRRLYKVYAWGEKKSKASWGGESVDYEKIAASAVQAMSNADLHRLLVVCALVSDLYCPGYDPKQSLPKDSNLALTAARYKIESAKVIGQVRAELSNPKNKTHRIDTHSATSGQVSSNQTDRDHYCSGNDNRKELATGKSGTSLAARAPNFGGPQKKRPERRRFRDCLSGLEMYGF